MKGISTDEWRLINYLNKHGIYKDNLTMQEIIINSFYNQHNRDRGRSDVNDNEWKDKLKYVQNHFGLFAQYAHNNWKHKQTISQELTTKLSND